MALIQVGAAAPDFALDDVFEKSVKLSDYKGKKVLLSWHPAAWTGVCADQMRSLEVNFGKFEALNTVPLGLSTDTSPCKKAWCAALCMSKVRLLCDFWPHGKVSRDYGIFIEEFGMSQRVNIIVGEDGIVKWVKVYPISELPDIQEVLQVLAEV